MIRQLFPLTVMLIVWNFAYLPAEAQERMQPAEPDSEEGSDIERLVPEGEAASETDSEAKDSEKVSSANEEEESKDEGAVSNQADKSGKSEEAKDANKPKKLTDKQRRIVAEEEASAIVFHWQELTKHAEVNLDTGQVSRYIRLQGELSFPHDTRVMGLTNNIVFTSALDQNGKELLPNRANYIKTFNKGKLPPNANYDALDFDSNDKAPTDNIYGRVRNLDLPTQRLKKITGFVGIRIGANTRTVDVPFKKMKKFKQLVPGLKYKLRQVNKSSSYARTYFYFARTDQKANANVQMDRGPAVSKVELIDDAGTTIEPYSNSHGSTSTDVDGKRHRVVRQRPRFRMQNHGDPKTLRLYVASEVINHPVKFKFKDVPIP